jgi:hypothetical protein
METPEYIANDAQDVILWRYMSLEKFIDFLRSKSLYLCRISCLDDQFEGRNNSLTIERNLQQYRDLCHDHTEETRQRATAFIQNNSTFQNFYYVNCWHASQFESDAMWRIYTADGRGIAIKTSLSKLKEVISTEASIHKVSYLDWGTDMIPEDLPIYKRNHFSYEQEWRIVKGLSPLQSSFDDLKDGIELKVAALDFDIVLPPNCSRIFASSVFAVMIAFKSKSTWHHSSLDALP